MQPWCSSALLLLLASVRADKASLDCPLRQIAIDYAQKVQPSWRSLEAFQELADALNGAQEAVNCSVKPNASASTKAASRVKAFPIPAESTAALILYVDARHGNDNVNGDGSVARPFQSLHRALFAVRTVRTTHGRSALSEADRAVIVLREGVFHLGGVGTLQLGPADSFLTIQAYPGEQAVVSGGIPLDNLQWEAVPEAVPKRSLYEYRSGMLGEGFDAAPPALMTVAEAQAKCSALPACAGITYQETVGPNPQPKRKVYFKYETFWQKSGGWSTYIRNRGYEKGAANLYRADLSAVSPALGNRPIDSLRLSGLRAVRARYPNVKTVEQLGAMQIEANVWTPQSSLNLSKLAKYTFEPKTPLRNDTAQGFFQNFKLGVGGDCAFRFTPQAGYWCANNTQGGGPGPYSAPVGMTVTNENTSFPHTPYGAAGDTVWASSSPTNPPLVHTWRAGRWFSWVMQANGSPRYDATSGKTTFDFSLSVGGNQGSRGGDAGQEMFIENVFEELDNPGEFWYDPASPATGKPTLWLWHNASGGTPPPASGGLVAPTLAVLINASGTQSEPVAGLSLLGVTFRDAAPTYLAPHGTPSGGDWAVSRLGAVLLEGTVSTRIEGCLLTSLDGNAVFLSGYNRAAQLLENEFLSIGETAISQWGFTEGSPVPGMGYDATMGNQPRGTLVRGNLVHELGLWTKQNSFYFQSESFGNTIEGNVAYNGPRAGINFDDGLGGGSTITRNVLANFCRESSDHGPFNSWDRQVYVYDDESNGGKPTVLKKNDTISYNFMLANYHSSMAIDNDDGSAFYDTHHNVFVSASSGAAYGGNSLKSDFGGHSNFHHDNVDLFWSAGFGICPQADGYADGYYGNYLYLSQDGDYGHGQACTGGSKTIVHSNTVWSPTGKITECGKSLAEWQAEGNDLGTVTAPYPPDATVLGVVRKTLQM
jgi:hypothetical protein